MSTVLAISSSPRRNGNSELVLRSLVQGVEDSGSDAHVVRLNELKFRPCQGCERCAATGDCIQKDDMENLYPQVVSASGLVLATPVYFGSMSAQLKMFIDRFQCWWHAKYRLQAPKVDGEERRPGFFICVGGQRKKDYCENALEIARFFFQSINFHYTDCLCYRGIDEKGAIKEHSTALQEAWEAGAEFAQGMAN